MGENLAPLQTSAPRSWSHKPSPSKVHSCSTERSILSRDLRRTPYRRRSQNPDHLRAALVGERYVHYGGVYAAIVDIPLASLGHRASLSNYRRVRLLVHQVGGGLAERAVILHK